MSKLVIETVRGREITDERELDRIASIEGIVFNTGLTRTWVKTDSVRNEAITDALTSISASLHFLRDIGVKVEVE